MTHILVIALMVVASVRELGPDELPNASWIGQHPGGALGAALGPFVALLLLQGVTAFVCVRRMDYRGDAGAIAAFEKASARVRMATLPLHASAVLLFGWLDAVRSVIGDIVLVDELIAALPAAAVLLVSWAAAEPVERRVREALLIRRLDEGLSIPPMPRAWVWWWGTVKQQLLFAAIPVLLILGWSEAVGVVRDGLWEEMLARGPWDGHPPAWAGHAPAWLLERNLLAYGSAGLQLGGVVVLLAMLPIALRYLWDTTPLGPGAVREALLGLCARYAVRVRGILVWRTHGAMVNGAVVGFLPRLRYIVLTDTLLESLPFEQVEAVAAHEVAHVRHRHIPWLAGSMVASGVCLGSAFSVVMRMAGMGPVTEGWAPVGLLVVVFVASLLLFGWASRRFEWQADVFAAQHLSAQEAGGRVSERGAAAMSGALRAVAMINGFPPERFTFRHGSIDGRRAKLREAVGEPIGKGRADRAARVVKLVAIVMAVAGLGLAVAETMAEARDPTALAPAEPSLDRAARSRGHAAPHPTGAGRAPALGFSHG
jgi:STE24 endopeptidase